MGVDCYIVYITIVGSYPMCNVNKRHLVKHAWNLVGAH